MDEHEVLSLYERVRALGIDLETPLMNDELEVANVHDIMVAELLIRVAIEDWLFRVGHVDGQFRSIKIANMGEDGYDVSVSKGTPFSQKITTIHRGRTILHALVEACENESR